MTPHATAADVAAYFLWLAANEESDDPGYLTPMQLQKLLYYAQGWALAEWDRPLFAEAIEAWPKGPVVPPVYTIFKDFGGRPIVEETPRPFDLDDPARDLIRAVWDVYKGYSGIQLSRLTHEERPWQEARGGLGDHAPCKRPLRQQTMRQTFRDKIDAAEAKLAARWERLDRGAQVTTARLTGKPTV